MRRYLISSLFFIFFLTTCNQHPQPDHESFVPEQINAESEDVGKILYSMYLPTDLAFLFERTGTNFNPALPAPVKDASLYDSDEQIAVMMGVYGVDMIYMKLLDQSLLSASYFQEIKRLSEKIGIPESIFQESYRKIEKYFTNEDSIASVIQGVYKETDQYFKKQGKDNLAAMALLGGWVEAMYIGTKIMENEGLQSTMSQRILQQKYSLNSLFVILSNYQESLDARGYLLMLKKLRNDFNKVEIKYEMEGFSVDTSNKTIETSKAFISYKPGTLESIVLLISQIREKLITIP